MFDQYIKEREGFDMRIRFNAEGKEVGFAIYKFFGDECYIKDIYVVPEERKNHIASKLADDISEIARIHGCKMLSGSVSLIAGNPTVSTKVLFGYGMEIVYCKGDLLWFKKSL